MIKSIPEISLKPLAEFVSASLSRKKSILKTIKSSDSADMAKKVKYNEAKSAIKIFMTDENHDIKIFETKYNQVSQKQTNTQTQVVNKSNTLQAIKSLEQTALTDLQSYLNFKSERGLPKEVASKVIDGVLVHLTPDLILRDKTTGVIVGAIKLVFCKQPITLLEGQIISGLLQKHIEKEYKVKLNMKNCFALDVFAKRRYTSPSIDEFKYYSTLLKKAYSEINTLWYKI